VDAGPSSSQTVGRRRRTDRRALAYRPSWLVTVCGCESLSRPPCPVARLRPHCLGQEGGKLAGN